MQGSELPTADNKRWKSEFPVLHAAPTIEALSETALNMLAAADENVACVGADRIGEGCGNLVKIAEEQADSVWSNVGQIALMLADRRSKNFMDLRAKINLCRRLAPETTFEEIEQTPDEALLCSIINDIERISG